MSYVYLLVETGATQFKIGVSANPLQRSKILPESFDLKRSLRLSCGAKEAYKVEKMLHFLFRTHKVLNHPQGDGCTEWFYISCYDRVLSFLTEQSDLINGCGLESIFLPKAKKQKNTSKNGQNLVNLDVGLAAYNELQLKVLQEAYKVLHQFSAIYGVYADVLTLHRRRVPVELLHILVTVNFIDAKKYKKFEVDGGYSLETGYRKVYGSCFFNADYLFLNHQVNEGTALSSAHLCQELPMVSELFENMPLITDVSIPEFRELSDCVRASCVTQYIAHEIPNQTITPPTLDSFKSYTKPIHYAIPIKDVTVKPKAANKGYALLKETPYVENFTYHSFSNSKNLKPIKEVTTPLPMIGGINELDLLAYLKQKYPDA